MADNGAAVEKKGRGRPPKSEDAKKAEKRPRAPAKKDDSAPPAKRGRGRPKKKSGGAAKPKVNKTYKSFNFVKILSGIVCE